MRSNRIRAIVALGFVASLGIAVASAKNGPPVRTPSEVDASRIQAGFNYAKSQGITLDLSGKNRALVGLGSYLVNAVGGCNDCHTEPPYTEDPYASLGAPKQINLDCYLAGGMAFGPFVSRDITPWEDGKPAGLTFEAVPARDAHGRGSRQPRERIAGDAVAGLPVDDRPRPPCHVHISECHSGDRCQHVRSTQRVSATARIEHFPMPGRPAGLSFARRFCNYEYP